MNGKNENWNFFKLRSIRQRTQVMEEHIAYRPEENMFASKPLSHLTEQNVNNETIKRNRDLTKRTNNPIKARANDPNIQFSKEILQMVNT